MSFFFFILLSCFTSLVVRFFFMHKFFFISFVFFMNLIRYVIEVIASRCLNIVSPLCPMPMVRWWLFCLILCFFFEPIVQREREREPWDILVLELVEVLWLMHFLFQLTSPYLQASCNSTVVFHKHGLP